MLKTDEGIRPNSSLEGLAKLNPVFDENGIVTAGMQVKSQMVHLLVW